MSLQSREVEVQCISCWRVRYCHPEIEGIWISKQVQIAGILSEFYVLCPECSVGWIEAN